MKKWDPYWTAEKVGRDASDDKYWAGAKKACDDFGMSLPDKSKLKSIYEAGQKDSSLGLPTADWFWSSSEYNALRAYMVHFSYGTTMYYKGNSKEKALCIGD